MKENTRYKLVQLIIRKQLININIDELLFVKQFLLCFQKAAYLQEELENFQVNRVRGNRRHVFPSDPARMTQSDEDTEEEFERPVDVRMRLGYGDIPKLRQRPGAGGTKPG